MYDGKNKTEREFIGLLHEQKDLEHKLEGKKHDVNEYIKENIKELVGVGLVKVSINWFKVMTGRDSKSGKSQKR